AVDREVHFAGATPELVALDLGGELGQQVLLADETEERAAWIAVGDDHLCLDLVAVLEDDARGAAVLDEDPRHRRIGPDLGTVGFGRLGACETNATRTAFGEAPATEGAIDLAHVVMEQHVGGAGRAHAEIGADDT